MSQVVRIISESVWFHISREMLNENSLKHAKSEPYLNDEFGTIDFPSICIFIIIIKTSFFSICKKYVILRY